MFAAADERGDRERDPRGAASAPDLGAKKLLALLHRQHPQCLLPGRRGFNLFRGELNDERPREALDQATPADFYTTSPRPMPDRVPPLEYPDRLEIRYVGGNGGIRWNSRWVNVSTVCIGEYVGLEEIADGLWNVDFGPLRLGRLNERHMRIEDEYGRLDRRHV